MKYRTPFSWGKHTVTEGDRYTRAAPTYPVQGVLWGRLESLGSALGSAYGGDVTERTAVVRLFQFPAVSPQDQLTDLRTTLVYEVVSLYQDYAANEMVCEVIRRG